ncbi:MAG TPA: hypothetical protein VLC46_00050 [Thermoanaerobaculia bacterium]|jgi:hypothetical protein|nr:hypothetical protein [Thermoanaerobaculia bacterium]
MRRSYITTLAILCMLPLQGLAQSMAVPVSITRAQLSVQTGVLRKIVARGERVYLLDAEHHRIAVVSGSSTVFVGQIGNGAGDLYQPFDLDVDGKGRVYVQDNGNARIAIFDANGRSLGGFADSPKSMGIAVNEAGDVYLGRPQLGSLVAVYDRSGRKLRSFGTVVRPSSILGREFSRYDSRAAVFNRVHLAIDDGGNVWVAFAFMPLLYKFSPDGRLLLEKRLTYPELKPVVAAIGQVPGPPDYAEMNFDGLQLPLVTRDVAWDAHAKRVLLLLGNERTVVLDTNARELAGFFPDRDSGNLQNVSVRSNGEVLASIFGSSHPYRLGAKSEQPHDGKEVK